MTPVGAQLLQATLLPAESTKTGVLRPSALTPSNLCSQQPENIRFALTLNIFLAKSMEIMPAEQPMPPAAGAGSPLGIRTNASQQQACTAHPVERTTESH